MPGFIHLEHTYYRQKQEVGNELKHRGLSIKEFTSVTRYVIGFEVICVTSVVQTSKLHPGKCSDKSHNTVVVICPAKVYNLLSI